MPPPRAFARVLLSAVILALLLTAVATASSHSQPDRGPTKVLVTGFGPFEHHGSNFTRNPSGEVALALDGWCHDGGSVCIDGLKINVSDAGVQVVQNALLRGNPLGWEGIVHLGLESTTKGLKVEVAALNNRARDNTTIVHDGAAILPTTIDLGRLTVPALAGSSGWPASQVGTEMWSRDAGHFYCNEVFYRTLNVARKAMPNSGHRLLPVVFVHLPLASVMSIDAMADLVSRLAYWIVSGTPADTI